VLSLYQAFEQMSDQRHKRGVRYPLAIILSLVVLGKLVGMTSLAGIAEWARLRADWLKAGVPLPRASLPCASTYGNVLRTIEAEEMPQMLAEWMTRLSATRRCEAEPSRLLTQPEARAEHIQVALDGKPLRGTLAHATPDQPGQHLVALYETQTGGWTDSDRRCPAHPKGLLCRHPPLRRLLRAARQGQPTHVGGGPAPLFRRAARRLP
jgi:hypothetical protein